MGTINRFIKIEIFKTFVIFLVAVMLTACAKASFNYEPSPGSVLNPNPAPIVVASPSEAMFAIVSAAGEETITSGHKAIAGTGFIQSDPVLKDVNGSPRVFTTLYGPILE